MKCLCILLYDFSPNVLVRFSDMNSFGFLKHVTSCPEDGGCVASRLALIAFEESTVLSERQ